MDEQAVQNIQRQLADLTTRLNSFENHRHSGKGDDGQSVRYRSVLGTPLFTMGVGVSNAAGTQVITTNFEPRFIVIHAYYDAAAGGYSEGEALLVPSILNQCNIHWLAAGVLTHAQSTAYIVDVNNNGATTDWFAAVTAFDLKSFTLTWTANGVPGAQCVYSWWAYGSTLY